MNRINLITIIAFLLLLTVSTAGMASAPESTTSTVVEAKANPDNSWKSYPTRTLEHLEGFDASKSTPQLSRFGGLAKSPRKATGYFRTERIKDRWWLVDPVGARFLHVGVASTRPGKTTASLEAFDRTFTSPADWASRTTRLLHNHAFNGTGAWSENRELQKVKPRQVYTPIWSFMANYGQQLGKTHPIPGGTGYPNRCIFVFDPGFRKFCDEHARLLRETRNDPWLLGHFTDNELPFDDGMLGRYLELAPDDHGRLAAEKWLRKRRGIAQLGSPEETTPTLTSDENEAFLEYVVDHYFNIVCSAIRKHDPNHLILGSRFNGRALRTPAVFRAAGKYLDVVSVNYYNAWTPRTEQFDMWVGESHKPILISEFYVKGEDSGMTNESGAGWIVRTQRERGMFYQNYTLQLLELKNCVGWHWFRYMDNDPDSGKVGILREDSNKGIVTIDYKPQTELLAAMKQLNAQVYRLAAYFDSRQRNRADQTTGTVANDKKSTSTKPEMVAPPGVVIERDINFLEPGREEKLDLYRPEHRTTATRSPAVVIIHGGGWVGGNKSATREFVTGTALAQEGYVCVSPEYSKVEGKRWPLNLMDCKNAVRWLRKNADRLQVDPDRIGVIGGSAGGHLALMVAYTADIPELEPPQPYPGISSRVHACVDMYGITNLFTRQKTDKQGNPNGVLVNASYLFSDPNTTNSRTKKRDLWELASPVSHVNATVPPTMIIHGTADTTVDRDQSYELASKLKSAGVEHELVILKGAGHAFPLNAKSLPRDMRPEVIAFFKQHLEK